MPVKGKKKKVADHKVRLGKYFYASLKNMLVIWKGQPCHHGSLLCFFKAVLDLDKSQKYFEYSELFETHNSMRSLVVFRIF